MGNSSFCFFVVQGNTEESGGADTGADAYGSIKHQDRLRIEPEKIRIWREEQAAMLQKKGCYIYSSKMILFSQLESDMVLVTTDFPR